MEIIILLAIVGWISSLFQSEQHRQDDELLRRWEELHPGWQDVLMG